MIRYWTYFVVLFTAACSVLETYLIVSLSLHRSHSPLTSSMKVATFGMPWNVRLTYAPADGFDHSSFAFWRLSVHAEHKDTICCPYDDGPGENRVLKTSKANTYRGIASRVSRAGLHTFYIYCRAKATETRSQYRHSLLRAPFTWVFLLCEL